jgi:tryptophan-rich sensory protein
MTPPFRPASDLPALAAAVLLTQGAGLLGAFATRPNIPTWYASLAKPAATPPSWAFGVVWPALYLLMAVSLWRLWRAPAGRERTRALGWFAVQLALNVAWSFAFFGARSPGLGLAVIVALLGAILVACVTAAQVDRLAAWLFAPYIAWVGFASWLNLRIVMLNGG